MADNMTHDVVHSSEIEGILLNVDEVRSSIARHLGIENVKQTLDAALYLKGEMPLRRLLSKYCSYLIN